MRRKRIGIVILVFVILVSALLALYLYSNSKPGVYAEETKFEYNCYFLVLDEKGRFEVNDFLIRHGDYMFFNGKYYLYKSKLVLISYHKDVELTFVADGDNWVFDLDRSKGLENAKIRMDDQAIWKPDGWIYRLKNSSGVMVGEKHPHHSVYAD